MKERKVLRNYCYGYRTLLNKNNVFKFFKKKDFYYKITKMALLKKVRDTCQTQDFLTFFFIEKKKIITENIQLFLLKKK